MDDLISVRQAAREADVTNQYIINLINAETLIGRKVGNQYVIDRASFDAWMQKRKKQQEEKSAGNV